MLAARHRSSANETGFTEGRNVDGVGARLYVDTARAMRADAVAAEYSAADEFRPVPPPPPAARRRAAPVPHVGKVVGPVLH